MTVEKTLDGLRRSVIKKMGGYETHQLSTDAELESFVLLLQELLINAEEEAKIVTRRVASKLYNHPQIIDALTQLGQKVEIIHSEALPSGIGDPKTTEIAALAKKGVLKMYSSSEEIEYDFWIVDQNKVMFEEPLFQGRNFVLYTRPSEILARRFRGHFDFLKAGARLD